MYLYTVSFYSLSVVLSLCVLSLTSALRVNEKHKASLQDILYYSLFKTENELLTELKAINSTCSMGSSGTRIIIWSLRRSDTHTPGYSSLTQSV